MMFPETRVRAKKVGKVGDIHDRYLSSTLKGLAQ